MQTKQQDARLRKIDPRDYRVIKADDVSLQMLATSLQQKRTEQSREDPTWRISCIASTLPGM